MKDPLIEWFERYQPRNDMLEGKETGFALNDQPICFESYGKDLAQVLRQADEDESKVWSLIEGEDDKLYVVSGYHWINCLGYALTKVAAPTVGEIEILWD